MTNIEAKSCLAAAPVAAGSIDVKTLFIPVKPSLFIKELPDRHVNSWFRRFDLI
jgi:hypothetical protein